MNNITLGKTGITAPQNGFGALPIQRDSTDVAVSILRKAYDGGMRFFDTARAYTDSEIKLGEAFYGYAEREKIYIATKSQARTPDEMLSELETSLCNLKTDYIDLYQLHCVDVCYRPGDGSGMYEALMAAKESGKVRHIGITTHKIGVAEEIVSSGLYETLQFPFSYLSSERDVRLVAACKDKNIGFIAMKGLAGGLITDSKAAFSYIAQFDNVMPIWGIQHEKELSEWLAFMDKSPEMTAEIAELIEKDKKELSGSFCRGCGYCMPCPVGIVINQCARMSLMLRRAPLGGWLTEKWQAEMNKIETCLHCNACTKKCPYGLDTPKLLIENLADYRTFLK